MGKEAGMMNDRTKIEILREELVIPQVVQMKADEAYAMVRELDSGKEDCGLHKYGLHNSKRRKMKKILPLVAAAILLLAGTVAAAGTKWSMGISKKWRVEEQHKERLQEEGAVSFVMQSQTQNGITVSAEQSVTDHYSVYIAFRVDGYSLKEGLSPGFEEIQVNVDGMDGINYSGGFYDGMADGDNDMLEYVNAEDGSMTYCISMTESERGWAIGRNIHVTLKNLCGYGETGDMDGESLINGIWDFSWNLQGTDQMREWTLALPVGESGAVIRRVELSPASGYVEYDWPRQRETRQTVGADGELVEISRWVRPPRMSGVRLKDGTVYQELFSGDGTEGYVSTQPESTKYYACRGCARIIDPEQVVGLFFENTKEGGFDEIVLTEN